MSNTTNSSPALPTNDEMLEMLNVDVLPFYDDYEAESFSFTEKYRAIAIVSESESNIVFALNNGAEVEIAKSYFRFPKAEKSSTIERLQGTLR